MINHLKRNREFGKSCGWPQDDWRGCCGGQTEKMAAGRATVEGSRILFHVILLIFSHDSSDVTHCDTQVP